MVVRVGRAFANGLWPRRNRQRKQMEFVWYDNIRQRVKLNMRHENSRK